MFHYFTLEEIYQYAEQLGYSRNDVTISDDSYEDEEGVVPCYSVSFGHEYTEIWSWEFNDLSEQSTDYNHFIWED